MIKKRELIIDPLVYSTFLGGMIQMREIQLLLIITGNTLTTGYTSSTDYPISNGAYNISSGGSNDVFISKFNANGTALTYSTFLGGSGDDKGYATTIDNDGNAYIAGYSRSTDYPVTRSGAYDISVNGHLGCWLLAK